MFDEEFINNLDNDPLIAAEAMCREFIIKDEELDNSKKIANYEKYLEAYHSYGEFVETISDKFLTNNFQKLTFFLLITTN
ncbi:MAG: hypothetical protein ACE5GM_09060 [bacterium]